MLHHSISHGTVSVLSVMSAELLVNQIHDNWPLMNSYFGQASVWLERNVPFNVDSGLWNQAIVALALGLAWGMAFWFITIRPAARKARSERD